MADNLAPSSSSTPGSPAEGTVDACPSMRALELIAGKWALRIFPALENGPVRNNELLRRVGNGISQKMLTQTLRELEANGLILRTIYDSVPRTSNIVSARSVNRSTARSSAWTTGCVRIGPTWNGFAKVRSIPIDIRAICLTLCVDAAFFR